MPDDKLPTAEQFDHWREVAQKALAEADNDPSDWYDVTTLDDFLIVDETAARGPFIAEFSPALVLRLLDLAELVSNIRDEVRTTCSSEAWEAIQTIGEMLAQPERERQGK